MLLFRTFRSVGPALSLTSKKGDDVADLKHNFGERLHQLRKGKGLTQEALGRATGIDYKHLGAIERGIKAPSFEAVERIAKALNVEPYLMFLPVPRKDSDLQADLRAISQELTAQHRARLRRFFQEVLRTMKTLGV